MTIERKNPIPAGRYWITLKPFATDKGAQFEAFTNWLLAQNGAQAEYAQSANRPVQIVATEDGDPEQPVFLIFKVLRPVPRWPDAAGLGLPTVAPPNVKSSGDVVQAPGVRSVGDVIEDIATKPDEIVGAIGEGVSTALKVVFAGAMAYFIVDLLINRRKNR